MDYITVVGEIVSCGEIKQSEQKGSFTYEYIELKNADNGNTLQTGEISVTDNVHALIKAGVKGTFVLGKANKRKVVIAIKTDSNQATLLEHASMNNIKAANVLKTMSTLGFVAAAFGLSQIWSGFDLSKSLLLMIFGALLGTVTGVQPIFNKRLRKKEIAYLKDAGFDVSWLRAELTDVSKTN